MFDIVSKHKTLVQIVLALITLPFMFFGAYDYFRAGDPAAEVATIGSDKVSRAEFEAAMREQQDRMRQTLGRNFDPTMFDSPEVKYAVLENVVNQRLLEGKAKQQAFRVSDAQLQQFIAEMPAFQDNGRFSPDRYRQALANQNMTSAIFEDRLRRELTLSPLQESLELGNIVARASGERYLALLEQRREVAIATVDAEPLAKDVKVDDAQAKTYYEANPDAFRTPEQAQFEYLLLTQEALAGNSVVDAADVRKQYAENAKAWTRPEERSAAHILIAVKPDAPDDQKAAAKKKAEEIAAQVKANPAKFAELAKQVSQDPGSAQQGGDLGSNPRGTMVKPFDDAMFAMKPGEIAGPVQTDFGWHVIKLNAIAPAATRPFDEVKGQIESDLRRQRAAQKFADAADKLQNLVYEQADSLAGAAKELGLPVQKSPLATRSEAQEIARGNAKFVAALFAPESVQAKRNTEAIEIGPGALIAGRIVEYKPAAPRPFDEVKDEIHRQLVAKGASEVAQKVGREKLALLEQGKSAKDAGVTFGRTVAVGRNQAQPGFPPDALTRIFRVDPAKVPQYIGAGNERGGYSIFKVEKVVSPAEPDAARVAASSSRVGAQIGREIYMAYVGTLKAKADVKINQLALEKK
ncbi:MAG: SurA N-terminal domain-containing protein [Betaproteobacteria bacterium]